MKRAILTLFLSAAVVILISAYDRPHSDVRFSSGQFEIAQGDSIIPLSDTAGRNLLVTFWSSGDAVSRLSNIYYAAIARQNPALVHVGVNFDTSDDMFYEILRRDNLTGDPMQYHVAGQNAADMIRRYGLSRGFQTYMVSPDGNVVARNPSADRIEAIVGSNMRGQS
ncbi:MAG: hypothetical protein K2L49_06350 [Muribaculaceae bacterium]|nr:hypothetical protein [Muribaculaceae bacterium]